MTLMVITGGSRSGKSAAAQRLVAGRGVGGAVVAVFGRAEHDDEMRARVRAHREARPDHLVTVEVESLSELDSRVTGADVLLVDCLGTALGACMEECWPTGAGIAEASPESLPADYAEKVRERFVSFVDYLCERRGDTVVVTNEVGSGLVSTWASGRLFADLLGEANRRLVTVADAAYLAVCGRMLDLKALPSEPRWPAD